MNAELQRVQEDNASLTRMLQSANDRLAEEAAETDAQVILATNLRQSLMEVTSELEQVRGHAARSQREAEQLRETNQRLQAELKFAAEERQTLTGHLRQMVDTLADENGRLKAEAATDGKYQPAHAPSFASSFQFNSAPPSHPTLPYPPDILGRSGHDPFRPSVSEIHETRTSVHWPTNSGP